MFSLSSSLPLLRFLPLSLSPSYVDEDTSFHADPVVWLEQEYPTTGALPTYLVLYDVLEPVSDEVSLLLPLHSVQYSFLHCFVVSSRSDSCPSSGATRRYVT